MTTQLIKELLEIYKVALESVKPSRLVERLVRIDNDDRLVISRGGGQTDTSIDLKNRSLHVIGGGKSVLGMAMGLANVVSKSRFIQRGNFSHGCLSLPIGLEKQIKDDIKANEMLDILKTEVHFGSANNLPDQGSITASASILLSIKRAIEYDESKGKSPLFIVLLSGGGSACLTSPRYVDLDTKLNMIKFLVQKGADIIEVNKVRRFFSRIKGGQLAKFIIDCNLKASILTLIISDVVGNPLEYIASGPTVINTTVHREDMLNVMRKYGYPITNYENLDTSYNSNVETDITNIIIGSNSVALEALRWEAERRNFSVDSLGDNLSGYNHEILLKLIKRAEDLSNKQAGKILVIGGGESTVMKEGGESWGVGGRLQEMAMDYMIYKLEKLTADEKVDVLLAASTDGQDGPTDVGACIASYSAWTANQTFDIGDLNFHKNTHDSYNFWINKKPDWLIKTGLTGTNVMDLYMYSLR